MSNPKTFWDSHFWKSPVWEAVARALNLLEIIAIIVGGLWVIWIYQGGDAKPRMDIHGSLAWSDIRTGYCRADYQVEVKNVGKRSVVIKRTRVVVESLDGVPQTLQQAKNARFLDMREIHRTILDEKELQEGEEGQTPDQHSEHSQVVNDAFDVRDAGARFRNEVPLVHSYAPDQRDESGFAFIVRRNRGAHILFRVELWRENDIAVPSDYDYRWDWVCGEGPTGADAGTVTEAGVSKD